MELRLSKSKYLSGMQCKKKLWLQFYKPDQAEPPSPALQRIFDQGTAIGELAQKSYPDGQLISATYYEIPKALEQTKQALQAGIVNLFEPAFVFAHTLVRVDILHRNPDSTFDIIEVKSTSSTHTEHIWDLAVQTSVLEGSGLSINRTILMHLDRACKYPDLSNLFAQTDLTREVREHLKVVPDHLKQFNELIHLETEPSIPIGSHCNRPYSCPFQSYCFKQASVPTPSIFNIPRLPAVTLDNLASASIFALQDIPETISLSESQRRFLTLYLEGKKEIHTEAIKAQLTSLNYPLYFLDFETDAPALPWLEGLGPYQKFPFQYSLHILESSGGLTHKEYLHTEPTDPRIPLSTELLNDIGPDGTIIAYNASFEKSVITSLASYIPDLSHHLLSLIPRFWDLLDIFRNHYFDSAFNGSNSIKSVLPVLCPDLSYKTLDIQDGSSAQVTWLEIISTKDEEKKTALSSGLHFYCHLDTLAMVRIYQYLKDLTG
ncbi:MAG: DUF2779 domain-containing protein [Spirochaetales bacterium]|nr:DUF2779 domain-containing protein [Spirochaetales bacterium]